mmetsp:Transcript_21853/g.69802  ORF Transcript_21853/g.69802 Transcript_21853/m.69802 type:complete len:213 (-) Transcript_21853:281-919(-)
MDEMTASGESGTNAKVETRLMPSSSSVVAAPSLTARLKLSSPNVRRMYLNIPCCFMNSSVFEVIFEYRFPMRAARGNRVLSSIALEVTEDKKLAELNRLLCVSASSTPTSLWGPMMVLTLPPRRLRQRCPRTTETGVESVRMKMGSIETPSGSPPSLVNLSIAQWTVPGMLKIGYASIMRTTPTKMTSEVFSARVRDGLRLVLSVKHALLKT